MKSDNDNAASQVTIKQLIIASGRNVSALTDALSLMINSPVVVLAADGEVVAASPDNLGTNGYRIIQRKPVNENEYTFSCVLVGTENQYRSFGWTITQNEQVLGYCLVLCDEDSSIPTRFNDSIEVALSLYVTHIKNRVSIKQENRRLKEAFFYDLLFGNIKSNSDIISMGKIWGWEFHHPHLVLVVSTYDYSTTLQNSYSAEILKTTVDRVLASKWGTSTGTTISRNMITAVIETKGNCKSDQKREVIGLFEDILKSFDENNGISSLACGVGQPYQEPVDLFRSFQEAKIALEIGTLKGEKISFFNEMGLDCILFKHDLEDLRGYFHQILGPLLEYEDEKEDLLSILESFVECGFSVNETAQITFLHRNTLRYKLSKIESILDCSLNDMETRLNLVAVFKIKRLHIIDKTI
ncbi:MAG: helix-turn-helix domain-containing protein [Coriobacteriales bacterium]|nr:helix-turn-helix domain-containing protein [Coriobacteriales bacterium]